ncbi:MAG: DinB family protein [Ferruginibacter sp.]
MSMIKMFLKELQQEANTTRKMLALIPDDKYQWKPHEKSMTIEQLSTHIAELPAWVTMTLNTSELDFSTSPYTPKKIGSTANLLQLFEESLADGKAALEKASEADLDDQWTLRNGETIYSTSSKHDVIRMTFSQIIHHRAQLGVNLRLLNIPIPGSYGPSADDQGF